MESSTLVAVWKGSPTAKFRGKTTLLATQKELQPALLDLRFKRETPKKNRIYLPRWALRAARLIMSASRGVYHLAKHAALKFVHYPLSFSLVAQLDAEKIAEPQSKDANNNVGHR